MKSGIKCSGHEFPLRTIAWISLLFCLLVSASTACRRADSVSKQLSESSRESATNKPVDGEPLSRETISRSEPEPLAREIISTPDAKPSVAALPDLPSLLLKGSRALGEGNADKAYSLARQAVRQQPDHPEVVFLMARVLGSRRRYPEAIQMLDELATSHPSLRLPVMGQTAEWMIRFGQWSKAENRYRSLLREIPDLVPVHRELGQLFLRQGRTYEAAEQFHHLCRLGDINEAELRSLLCLAHPFARDADANEFDPIGTLGWARTELGQGNRESARERLEQSESIGPQELALLGRIYVIENDFEALENLSAEASEDVNPTADIWLVRAAQAARLGDHQLAIDHISEALLIDQTDPVAYGLFSKSLKTLKQNEAAIEAASRADLIKQTHDLGVKMAASDHPDDKDLDLLVQLLERLRRPCEAMAWQGVQLVYAEASGTVSDAEIKRRTEAIITKRSGKDDETVREADRQFILCQVDEVLNGK